MPLRATERPKNGILSTSIYWDVVVEELDLYRNFGEVHAYGLTLPLLANRCGLSISGLSL